LSCGRHALNHILQENVFVKENPLRSES
jgi:hypothetical protein